MLHNQVYNAFSVNYLIHYIIHLITVTLKMFPLLIILSNLLLETSDSQVIKIIAADDYPSRFRHQSNLIDLTYPLNNRTHAWFEDRRFENRLLFNGTRQFGAQPQW